MYSYVYDYPYTWHKCIVVSAAANININQSISYYFILSKMTKVEQPSYLCNSHSTFLLVTPKVGRGLVTKA